MRRRPVSLSSSYLTLEPAGISTTTMNRAGRCSPGTTSCQGWAMGSLGDNAESRPHWDVISCAGASPRGKRGDKLHGRQRADNMRGVLRPNPCKQTSPNEEAVPYPKLLHLRQHFNNPRLEDVAGEVKRA